MPGQHTVLVYAWNLQMSTTSTITGCLDSLRIALDVANVTGAVRTKTQAMDLVLVMLCWNDIPVHAKRRTSQYQTFQVRFDVLRGG